MSTKLAVLLIFLWFFACTKVETQTNNSSSVSVSPKTETVEKITNNAKVIHVLVALCDNENQGIVPVPAFLGNGEDTVRNLYWGAAYGVKTYFGKSKSWQKVATIANPKENVLERIVFKHKTQNAYMVADAYRGSKMRETIDDFFYAVSGKKQDSVTVNDQTIQLSALANLIAFVGHNGLMDFKLDKEFEIGIISEPDAIVLACASRNYFAEHLRKTNAKPILWTTNLMAPEAYILHDALEGWVRGETDSQVQTRAAKAYAKFQRISVKSASRLLVTGW